MPTTHSYSTAALRETAQQILRATLGDVTLDDGKALDGWPHVHRFHLLKGPAAAPTSIIVKQSHLWEGYTYNPDASEGLAVQLFDDWAGVQFLDTVAGDLALSPRFYGGERTKGVLVLEDLVGVEPLAILEGSDPALAEALLIALATTLGRMHARTMGQQTTYKQIRDTLGPREGKTDIHGYFYDYAWMFTTLEPTLAALRMTASSALAADLEILVTAMQYPGPFLAYTHGDPSPDNGVWVESSLRLLDFERAAFRHALLDGVFGRLDFPSWCCSHHISDRIVQRIEDAYRTELAETCPEATDDTLFFRGIVAACGYRILSMYQRYDVPSLIKADSHWHAASLRQRLLSRSPTFIELTARYSYLETLGTTIADIAERLQAQWPSEAEGMPIYPAFR